MMNTLEIGKSTLRKIVKDRIGLTSNYAAAYAARDADVDVVAAYPITPQTPTVEKLAEFVANGEIKAEYIPVESEHSALSALIGASAAGARVFTATSSQGLFFMYELLYIASGLRLPIVMAIATRAASAPICIHGDYQDLASVRDAGWIIMIASTAQEVYDSVIMAYRIAEDNRVLLPTIVAYDGFVMSHTMEPVELYHEEYIRRYAPKNMERLILDSKRPITMGVMAVPEWYYEIKYQLIDAVHNSMGIIKEVHDEFNKIFGRNYRLVEEYMMDGAEYVIVGYGGIWGNIKRAVDEARKSGIRAGALRIRLYRPFPSEEILRLVEGVNAIAVVDRATSPGAPLEGPIAMEIAALMNSRNMDIPVISTVHGLGQRTVYSRDIYKLIKLVQESNPLELAKSTLYMGVREYGNQG